ncbi:MAG: 4Fe-4S binding protein [Chitinispirillaceae bacterium]|nr:4Fe-4S binding protein [Chitinispirillaceae bacterium]
MKRKIIKIDEKKCTGCGNCIPACPEGAIQIIDGKARLISDLFCDGLGACLGHCPEGAITIEEREAEPYNERKTMENIVKQGRNVVKAHLEHLRAHNEHKYLQEALNFLKEKGYDMSEFDKEEKQHFYSHSNGCPGSRSMIFNRKESSEYKEEIPSYLRHWPIQLHLISPLASYYKEADVLLVADCVAYSFGDFHSRFLNGKSIAIACPKLDQGKEIYVEKIRALIDEAQIKSLTVIIMQVPCCGGLLRLAEEANNRAQRKIDIKCVVIGIDGSVIKE